MAVEFQYRDPGTTYTLAQLINCQSDTDSNYQNLSFVDEIFYQFANERIKYPAYNVVGDYIDAIREEYCIPIVLTDEELIKYNYRPKLLAAEIYGNGELGYIILMVNDMYSVKQFTRHELILPTKNNMSTLCSQLYNANITAIQKYNSQNTIINR